MDLAAVIEEKDTYLEDFALLEKTSAGKSPSWLRDLRGKAIEDFLQKGFPTVKDENWRYTNVAPWAKIPFRLADGSVRPSVEDIDFGYRLTEAGHQVVLDATLSACHLKRWSVYSSIISDIRDRGIPWTQLILRYKALNNDLNLRIENRLSIPLAYLMLVLLALAPYAPRFLAGLPPTGAALIVLNLRYYGFFYEKRGGLFAVGAWGLHLLHHLCNGFSLATGTLLFLAARYLDLRLPGALSPEPWSAKRLMSAPAAVAARKRAGYATG